MHTAADAPAATRPNLVTLNAADRRIRELGKKMFELKQEAGAATRGLLRAEGFSNFELDEYGDAAAAYARGLEYRDGDAAPGQGFTKTDEEVVAIAVDAAMGLVGDAQIVTAALSRGLTPAQVARNWQKIARLTGLRIGTLSMPKVA